MRHGLSYMEVLIAAGIALAGILGAVAMFPVAIQNMQKGVTVDMMAAAGPSALEQAKVLGVDDNSQWLAFNGTNGQWTLSGEALLSTVPPAGANLENRDDATPWSSICFDPRFCAELSTPPLTANDARLSGQRADRFPYALKTNPSDPRMVRMSLKRNRSETALLPMSVAHSRLAFKIGDDLIFDRSSDITIPAGQSYILSDHDNNAGTPGVTQRRNYMAEYEFMLTMVPKLNGVPVDAQNKSFPANQNMNSPPESLPLTGLPELYTLSAIVLHKRQTRLDSIIAAAGDPGAERVVDVLTFYSNGAQGGDVRIQGPTEEAIQLHEGDFVMLSKNSRNQQQTFLGQLFQWYRVVGLSLAETDGTSWFRDVTLEGGDWPTGNPGATPTRMTIVSGAVGVFETTIQVE